ncbi:Nuclear transcription factor Y subunit gamma [Strongyloides ratti]|uniref:Nuclear transcription factor Y subunit gamma n=1 Tax=Strongyloides ratti TaxID=34506 RepID=A0A090LF36_STRRB|nr:Nuclear transcription factor Y subunit gamma [Strongyloides ratti]CEF68382.1 Nuclear transcription factor Y subunit gamma [Strongyloides ratti]
MGDSTKVEHNEMLDILPVPPTDVGGKSEFWRKKISEVESHDAKFLRDVIKYQVLPLARVKKIMKIDDQIRDQMISAEVPLVLSIGAELFIEELMTISYEAATEHKRKTIQKTDISLAVSRNDHFDFLIDFVPRDIASSSDIDHENKFNTSNGQNIGSSNMVNQTHQPYMPAGTIINLGTVNNVSEDDVRRIQDAIINGGTITLPSAGNNLNGQPVQYVVNYNDESSSGMGNATVQLEDGRIMQATPIGPSIELPSSAPKNIPMINVQRSKNKHC